MSTCSATLALEFFILGSIMLYQGLIILNFSFMNEAAQQILDCLLIKLNLISIALEFIIIVLEFSQLNLFKF